MLKGDRTSISASNMTLEQRGKSEARRKTTPTRTPKKCFTPQKNYLLAGSAARGHQYSAVKPRLESVYDSNQKDYKMDKMIISYKKQNKRVETEITKLKAKRKSC